MRYLLSIALASLAVTSLVRAEVVIHATDLAPASTRADSPKPGKWWLKRDAAEWGAPGGAVLMTGWPEGAGKPHKSGEWEVTPLDRYVAYRVPALTIDPKVRGWHRIHIGLYNEPEDPNARLLGKLSGEPYPEYLQTPQQTKGKVVEIYWKAADLTDKTIHLEQPPGPMPHTGSGWLGGVSHLRLAPVPESELASVQRENELPPANRRLFGLLDYTDEVFWWGDARTEDDMRAIVYRHREAGFGRIYWRCFGTCSDNTLSLPESAPRWTETDEKRWTQQQKVKAGWLPYIDLTRRFDPLQVAAEYGGKIGCEVHAWVRLTNFNREPRANFWHDHPEWRAQMLVKEKDAKTGQMVPVKPYKRTPYGRVMSFAYPEVRAFYLKVFRQLASTGTRGILIDLLRHPPVAGYEPIVSEAFKQKYGMDMEEREVYRDPLVQEHLSQYLKLFLIELRKEVGKDIEIGVRCSGPEQFALRGKQWIEEGLIDTIIDGNWYSGNGPRPTIDATVAAVGTRGKAMAIAESGDVDPSKNWAKRPGWLSNEAIAALAKHYSGRGVSHFGLYESTVFTWYPDARRTIRAAGWSYDPDKATKP